MLFSTLHAIGAALDGLGIGFCMFDAKDHAQVWNETFLELFPEHRGHIHKGEHYAHNLRRFYHVRLAGEERQLLERYVAEGLERHRNQHRPYEYEHRGSRIRVSSLPMGRLGRVRVWRRLEASDTRSGGTPGVAGAPTTERESPARDTALQLLQRLPDGIAVVDAQGLVRWANGSFLALYRSDAIEQVAGRGFAEIYRNAWRAATPPQASLDMLAENERFCGAPFELELPEDRWVRVIEQPADPADGEAFFVHVDITAQKRQQRQLRDSEARYHLLAEYSSDVTVAVRGALTTYVSPSVTQTFGWQPDDLIGRSLVEFCHPDDVEALQAALTAPSGEPDVDYRARAKCRDGGYLWVEARSRVIPTPSGESLVINIRSIAARKAVEDQLAEANRTLATLASTDPLTGVANRRTFDEALEAEWKRAQRGRTSLALLSLDLDNFKSLNDRFGHPAGDEVLRRMAAVFASYARREGDLCARTGGEEFCLLLPNTPLGAAAELAERLRKDVAGTPMPNGIVRVTVSIGACAIDDHSYRCSPDDLVRSADQALYAAKRSGKNKVAMSTCTCSTEACSIAEGVALPPWRAQAAPSTAAD